MTTTGTRPTYDVTSAGRPDDILTVIIHRELTRVHYITWLGLEIERWQRTNGRECWVREDSEGLVWLQSWAEYQMPVTPEDES